MNKSVSFGASSVPQSIIIALALFQFSCADERQSEDYDINSPTDISLTKESHPHGWTREDCFACHVKANIHVYDSTDSGSLPLARDLVKASGIRSCKGCHGPNGVSQ